MSTISSISLLANYWGAESYYQKWRIKLRAFQAKNGVRWQIIAKPYLGNGISFQYDECSLLSPFIQMNKAVFAIDYNSVSDGFCTTANQLNFDGIKKNWDLDAWLYSCR